MIRKLGGARGAGLSALLLATTAFAWLGVIRASSAMQMSGMPPMPQMEPLSAAALITFTLEWGVMMTAMMLPSAAPMILLYGRSAGRARASGERVIPAAMFATTYVGLWLLTGVPVYLAWFGIGEMAERSASLAAGIPYAVAATLLAAGAYQFSPAKRACLRECASPADFLVRRWRSGYMGSVRLAAMHAAFCIGCCWALMVILVTAGAMSLPWVLAIALLVFAEKVLPGGERTSRVTGALLIIAAAVVAARPELAAVVGMSH